MTINDWLYSGPPLVAAGLVEIEISNEPVPDTGAVEWGFTSGSGWGNNHGVLPPVVHAYLPTSWFPTPAEAKAALNLAAVAWARGRNDPSRVDWWKTPTGVFLYHLDDPYRQSLGSVRFTDGKWVFDGIAVSLEAGKRCIESARVPETETPC
jgi:hypothetical protein